MYYHSKDNNFTLYRGNSIQVLSLLQEQVDMIFADPPYFLSNGGKKIQGKRMVSVDKGDWDKVESIGSIDKFNQEWIDACKPLLKNNGTIWACGTFHNIYSVEKCLKNAGFQIINIITWQKSDPTPTWGELHFNFSSEYIIWARKNPKSKHYFNYELMKELNGGVLMPDVWKLPTVGMWEKTCGKHPTQKPLRLLYRIILASTKAGEVILDPFAGSCSTGIAANLLGRKFIGIDQSEEYLDLGKRRKIDIETPSRLIEMQKRIAENPEEVTVMINHARKETKTRMIETGICYLRAGESDGSLCVTPGFERLEYVLLHTGGNDCKLFKLKQKGRFQIWTKEALEKYGFTPSHAPYYVVLRFNNQTIPKFKIPQNLKERLNTYRAKIRPLSDFLDFSNI
jgi:site-specific DNA-methyltransferase (adenine-specific)